MCACFHNVAVLHDQNQIGVADRGQAVRDDKARTAFHQRFHALLNQDFRPRVDRGRVASSRIRIFGSAKKARAIVNSCFCPLRNVAGFTVDHRLIAMIQRADKVIHMRRLSPPR